MEPIKIDKPFLDSDDFIANAKWAVLKMVRDQLDPTDRVDITIDNIYEVTHCFVLGSQKAMLSTTLQDGKYYEVTYDANKHVMYVVAYAKINQINIPVELSK